MEVVVVSKDLAEAISEIIHRAEEHGYILTEFEDEMWSKFTDQINAFVEVW